MTSVEELNRIIGQLGQLKGLFKRSPNLRLFLETEDQGKFVALVTEAKTLLKEALGPANDFNFQLIFTVNSGSGMLGGASLACVEEVDQLLRSAVRTIERKARAQPLKFAKAAMRPPYVNPSRIAELQGLRGQAWNYSKLPLQLRSERRRNFETVLIGRETGFGPWTRGKSRGQVRALAGSLQPRGRPQL